MLFSLFFNEGLIVRRLCPLMIGLASAGDLPPWLLNRQHFGLFRTTFLGPPCLFAHRFSRCLSSIFFARSRLPG